MAITLPALPYAEDALAPAISADTLRTHHGKHHKAYVDKVNDAVKNGPLASASLKIDASGRSRRRPRKSRVKPMSDQRTQRGSPGARTPGPAPLTPRPRAGRARPSAGAG